MTTSTADSAGSCPVRAIYFATHFGNWYVNAPVEEVCAYIRKLADRGTNHLMLWLDPSNFHSLHDPAAQALLARLRRYADTARQAQMRVGLVRVANGYWRNAPVPLRADPRAGRGAIMLSDLCPSLPAARTLLEQSAAEDFQLFEHLDFLCLWPYDGGGCGCPACQPWASNGFLVSCEIAARQFRARFPSGQLILSTWYMSQVEWQAVRARIESRQLDWVDAILAELFHDGYPADLLRGDVPRDLPLLGFPEISMEAMTPWGGCGANPRPAAIEKRWREFGQHVAGGFPYSEGIHEDVNKAIYEGLYQQRDRAVDDILRGYVAREFSPAVAEDGVAMLRLMESTAPRQGLRVGNLDAAPRVWELATRIQATLPAEVASRWPWRVLYLRARIDALLNDNDGRVTTELRDVFAELHALYHSDETSLLGWVLPPLPPRRTSPDPLNLAGGARSPRARVSVSSTHPELPGSAQALVDDVVSAFDPQNFWSSASGDPSPTVVIDLGDSTSIGEVQLQFRGIEAPSGWYEYRFVPSWVTIEWSTDGHTYRRAVDQSRDVPINGQQYKQWFYPYPVAATGRYLKLILGPSQEIEQPSAGCVQLTEIRVHGAREGYDSARTG